MSDLAPLHAEIDARVSAIRDAAAEWPCAKGCATCCRELAALPQLTPAEWTLLREGLGTLPASRLAAIEARIVALGPAPERPVVCPLLDPASGACPVYLYRPVACRTYGFYVERDKGLICARIEADIASGKLKDIVWGNQTAVARQQAGHGEPRSLTEWFVEQPPRRR